MTFRMKAVIPKSLLLDPQKLARAIDNTLTGNAKAVKVDFQVTTQTWVTKPDFVIEDGPGKRTISTDNEIYGYVNDGTRPHIITAKNKKVLVFGVGGRPKTRVRAIGSTKGSEGNTTVFAKSVQHPGTEARAFDEVIADKWTEQLPVTLQRAIDSEV